MRSATIEILRTPDERFAALPGYPFEPHYVDVPSGDGTTLRMHYVDEGPPGAEPVLLLHGEPSWSYLYRKMIPVLVDAGLRAVAIDLVGFGRSDKPASRDDYTYQAHIDWTWAAIDAIGLHDITLVCQDWGGLLGLRHVGEHPERFARVVAANTALPTGDHDPGDAFRAWQRYSQETPEFHVGRIVSGGCVTELAPDVVAAYDAPFPDDTLQGGCTPVPAARAHHAGRPRRAGEPRAPGSRCVASTAPSSVRSPTPTRSPAVPTRHYAPQIPGAAGQPHTTITGAGHFLQEDRGEELARVVAAFVASTS